MLPDRTSILRHCRALLEARASEYTRELAGLDEAAAGETKSSAGDKYETAREMIAQSRGILERNLSEARAGLDALTRMSAAPQGPRILFGTLAETSQGWHLLGASLGELEIDGNTIRLISLASPLGAALKGKSAGDRVPWRGGDLEILRIAQPAAP